MNLRRSLSRCLALALLCSFAYAGPMVTSGQFEVSPTGAATYTIPLSVPPGTAGIEPKLSLVYNSQAGNGLLGVGWSLSGLSVITRCPRTMAQDGVRGGINFDANDRFCLDGQRLMAVSGSYGADGTEYRTERESFSKVVSYGSAGSGPAWFKVWTKAGQILEYGNTADSRIEAQGKASVRVWALNRLSDTKGNYFTVAYNEDNANGDYSPARIDYTGNAGLAPNNSVQFVYEARPDSMPLYFQGSLVKTTQRLTKVQTYSDAVQGREYRLAYGTGTTTSRSRITSITECALPDSVCKPALTPTWTEYGANAFNAPASWTSLVAGFLADVDGDGRADFVAQQSDGLYVALSQGTTAAASSRWVGSFGYSQGYSDQAVTPLYLLDVNGDGLADAVGIASDGVYVALSNGSGFSAAARWLGDFGTGAGWTNMDTYPRFFADVNGDGRPDIVGFKGDGVYVSLNIGTSFAAQTKWTGDFGTASAVAYASNPTNPRLVLDVNGDGLADIVGFANGGTYVALNTGTGFAAATLWLADFGVSAGYGTQDTYPRTLADVNGDGLSDVVGFKGDGVYVAINTGTGLQAATRWLADFGTATATAYSSQKGFPRFVADVNGDGKADVVGFAANGIQVAFSTGTVFSASSQWVAGLGSAAGYTTSNPRQLADVDGDGFPDAVGTLSSGTSVARTARTVSPDLVATSSTGLGGTTTLAYGSLTTAGLYVRGVGATYPQTDITAPLYVVSSLKNPNALGSGYTTTNYQYGGLRVDLSGRGLAGFGWLQAAQAETGIADWTYYRQDWPYGGMPLRVMKTLMGYGDNGLLRVATHSYGCLDPQSGAACAVTAGNRYFPYLSQTIEAAWESNGIALPTVTTTNSFDPYGNAVQVTVATSDGITKTTTNIYANDATNWFLGRLTRSQVASITGAPNPSMPNGVFDFNETISANTLNYNLKNAALAAGWDGASLLNAKVTVNAGVYVWSDSTALAAFDTGSGLPPGSALTLVNNGYVMGKGGTGGGLLPGETGGSALHLAVNATITTTSGYIAGGGGGGGGGDSFGVPIGGGGGAGGGQGGWTNTVAGGSGGGPSTQGSNGTSYCPWGCLSSAGGGGRVLPGGGGIGNINGYGAGGGGGAGGAGGLSGVIVGPGGAGGAGANVGASAAYVGGSILGGGGGGWGAAGGTASDGAGTATLRAPGAGGKAINTNGHSVTWTTGSQPSTVYGAVN